MEKMTVEMAKEILGKGYHCSQCVFVHRAEELGMDANTALKVSGGLGGGGFNGDMCGAVSGAILAISLKYGYNELTPDIKAQNLVLMKKVKEFEAKFKEKFGGTNCREIIGYDFGKPEDMKKIAETHATKNCPALCATACDILDEILGEDFYEAPDGLKE